MRWVSLEQLKQLANGEDFVFTLERLLLEDSLVIYDDTGKPIWFIHDYDSLIDGVDIIEEKLREIEKDRLILEYFFRWSLAQFYFCDDKLHQVRVKVYYLNDGVYRLEKFYDDGTHEVEKVPNERKLIEKMSWHGYGRVLYFTYIDDDIPKEILKWIKDRGSWAKILVKETI
jgi:hypothetical protein